jgi:phage tail sheath protein FI
MGHTSTYAAAYTPWLEVANPNPLAARPTVETPPCGHVLGLIATNDRVNGVHHAPANLRLEWVADWTVDYTTDEHARHNDNGINVLRAPCDGGLRVLGARTLGYEPVWKFLNVRRLLIFIERSMLELLSWCVHEPNNHETRAKARLCVTAFLLELLQNGAFAGATPDESFGVRCDESNNPPELRDSGALLIEILVAPTIPMEFIVLRIGRVENALTIETETALGGGAWPR